MFWNDPEHYLESIILIEDEDDILSIPRQIQVYCIAECASHSPPQGFPALVGLGDAPLPGGVVLPVRKHWQHCQYLSILIDWLTNQSTPIVLQTKPEYRTGCERMFCALIQNCL